MQPYPQLKPEAVRVLNLLLDYSMMPGGALIRLLGASSPAEVVGHIRELQKYDLVEVSGEATADGLPYATIGIRPSMREYLRSLVKQLPIA
jgi:hypothetical protein